MSDTVRSLSTSGLAPKKQLQTWSDALTDLCGQFDVDPLEGSSLEGRINYTTVSQLKLCQIEASQHRIAHTVSGTKLSEHPYVKILFQTYGISHFEQGGRRIDIMPGDCLAYDVSCTHTIVSPSLTRHEVVIVRVTAPAASPTTSCTPRLMKRTGCLPTTPSASPIL